MAIPQIPSDVLAYLIFGALVLFLIIIFIYVFLPSFIFRKSSIIKLRRDTFDILRKLSEDTEKSISINEFLESKPDKKKERIKLAIKWLRRRGFISGKLKIKINEKGLIRFNENYREIIKFYDEKQHQATIILLTILSIIILFTALQVQLVQTSILEKTSAPRQAVLEIIPDKDDLIIPAFELVGSSEFDSPGDMRWAWIDLTILNFGQMDSNHMHCFSKIQNEELFTYIKTSNFENIPAGSSNRTTLHIKYHKCQKENKEFCDKPGLVPLGVQNITLECECYGCKEQRYFTNDINFCIYNENRTSDCSDY